ncbi:hypothetical protein [Paraliobacillus sp. JSM ZJ581]|uniref:hypothetical protein n=1 Tax=Paraliobacillus sp. JSM ZJ581 TaxID=3342118 RepID=UPI0035A95766
MKNNYIRSFIITCLVFLVSCSSQIDQNTLDKYKYGVILSEQRGKSELQLYTEDGDLVDTKKIAASGVDENGSAYLNGPQFENENWYIGVASDSKSQDFIIKIDPETLTVDKVPANVGDQYLYTGYTVDEDNLYTFYSTPGKGTHIIKSRMSNNEVLKEKYIKNSLLLHVIPKDDKVILVSDDLTESGMYIRIANEDTLEIEKEFKIADYLFTTDIFIKENNLYMLPAVDSEDTLINQLLVFNIRNGKWQTVELPFKNARYLRAVDDHFYIIEQPEPDIDPDRHTIAKLDIETLAIEDTFTFDFASREVIFEGDRMISSSDDKIYIYNTDDFELINEIEISNPKDMMFGSLLVKP